jgi:hypothetical protein
MQRYTFNVERSRAPAVYDVHVHHPDGRVTDSTLDFDFSGEGLVWRAISGIESGRCGVDDIRDVGSQLWNALCPKEVRDEINAIKSDEPIVLTIDVPNEREIEALPWESVFSLSSNTALCTDARYSLTRATPADMPPPSPNGPTRPIRMLVVIPEGSELPVAYEWSNLERFVSSQQALVELHKLDGVVTADVLEQHLQERWDIFHYIGHGECDANGKVSIRLNRDRSESGERFMDALTFAQLISNAGIRLAVLNCCKGASPSTTRTLSGLGPHLARTAGIPAIVAMRYETLEPAAIRFSEAFYRSLLSGNHFGRVDLAVQAARRSLSFNTEECGSRSYINPVLYVRDQFECLFDRAAEPAAAPRAAPRRQAAIPLPDDLQQALEEGRCVFVVGPGIQASSMARRRGGGDRSLYTLLGSVAQACQYPDASEIKFAETAGDGYCAALLARVCQHYQNQNREQRFGLIRFLRQCCSRDDVPNVLRALASIDVAGYLYTHFDGLLEEAVGRSGVTPRIVNSFSRAPSGGHVRPTIVNLRGSLSDPANVVLTETDHEERFDALKLPVTEIAELFGEEIGRTVILLGASPRDPILRRALSQHLDTSEKRTQGARYIVSPVTHPVDEAYWHRFNVHWIPHHPEAVVEALVDARGH